MTTIDTSTEAVERLLEDVTPGPWVVDEGGSYCDVVTDYGDGVFGEDFIICEDAHQNARFIAAARDLVPALLKDRDEARAKLDAAVDALRTINILDPEEFTDWCSEHVIKGFVSRMGNIARAALAKIKGANHE